MSYALSHLGEAEVVAAQVPVPTPNRTIQAAAVMMVLTIPWLPVLGGAWVGKKWKGTDGAWVGALAGFTLSTLVIRNAVGKIGS